jgi:chaperonin GroEL
VPGGGVAFLRAIAAVDAAAAEAEGDRRTGLKILARALQAPARQIAQNSELDPGVVVERVLAKTGAYGFNAATGAYGDLERDGIIDPLKVVRVALENAVSVAGTLLLAEATCTEIPEKDAEEGRETLSY